MVGIRNRKGGRDGAAGGVDSTYDNAKNRRSKGNFYLPCFGILLVLWLVSPYRIQLTETDSPPIIALLDALGFGQSGGSDGVAKMALEQETFQVPEFVPIDFTPQNGAQEQSFELYKKARIIDPNDVIINKKKVSWFNFDIKGENNFSTLIDN